MTVALFIAGAACELLGIVLIAAPDLVPGALRIAGWIRAHSRPFENRIRGRLGFAPRRKVVEGSATVTARASLSASAIVGHASHAPLEEKVDFLMRRNEADQEAMNRLSKRVEALEESSTARLDELRREVEARIESEIETAQADFRVARIGGTVALTIGLALTTAANFV